MTSKTNSKTAAVLLSGGIDSTTCLALAVSEFSADEVFAVSFQYGQKHDKELECAKKIAERYNVEWVVYNLSGVFEQSDCSLLKNRRAVKHQSYAEQLSEMGGSGTVDTYVPFRNGLMLSYTAACAISRGAKYMYYGAHSDDAAGGAYPDCTPEFNNAVSAAIYEGSGKTLEVRAPFIGITKAEVVKIGLSLNAPYELTWSCYEGGDKPCGKCATCLDRAKAFSENGVCDPALMI